MCSASTCISNAGTLSSADYALVILVSFFSLPLPYTSWVTSYPFVCFTSPSSGFLTGGGFLGGFLLAPQQEKQEVALGGGLLLVDGSCLAMVSD